MQMFDQLLNVTKTTSFKIAFVVSLLSTGLLLFSNFIILEQSKQTFIYTVGRIGAGQFGISSGGVGRQIISGTADFLRPISFASASTISAEALPSFSILDFDTDGSRRQQPLQETYVEILQKSLLIVGALGIIGSILIGIFASTIFGKPLKVLGLGINKLKESNYKVKIKETGTTEFDNVITEFNNLSDELQRVEDLRKDLISDTSHELKTPITSLLVQLEGLKDGVVELNENRIETLVEQVKRIDDLVDRLQEYTRLRNRTQKAQIINFRFIQLVDSVISNHNKKIEEKNIKMNLEIEEDYILSADKVLVERVINNLLENALEYSEAKNIFVKANSKEIIFEDDGIGIPDIHRPYIFERFYRVEKSRNRATGGLGLGLSIVKEIIEAHGWKIEVSSHKENRGVKFTIIL